MKKSQPFYGFALLGMLALSGCGALSDQANDQQDPGQTAPPPASASTTPSTATATASTGSSAQLSAVPSTTPVNGKNVTLLTMPSGLKYYDVKVGTGAVAKSGDKVSMLYTGKLMNGTVFDSTANRGNQPYQFTVGTGQVIQGWDLGIPGMKVGGERILVIPSNLGYGANPPQGAPIPPNATLIFDVTLQGIG